MAQQTLDIRGIKNIQDVTRFTSGLNVDNLLDSHTTTSYKVTINPGTGVDRLERAWTFRPRTIGLSFTFRQ